jgi:hypothetical protein
MKTVKKSLGWLVVAAALTIGMAACSSDADSIVEPTIQEPAPTSLHITVGAGIANDNATTRADVVNGTNSETGKATHTLVFTTGDRLYFWRYIDDNYLSGILTMDGSPSADGLSATFSGDVKMYDNYNKEITNYDYSSINKPLSGSTAYIIPSGAASGCFNEANHLGAIFNQSYSIAKDVNTLMKTALYVEGSYDDTQQRYTLTKQMPILNCALGGLTPNTAYTVKLRRAYNQEIYKYNVYVAEITYASTVTTDAFGNVRFAISGSHKSLNTNNYWVVQLSSAGHTKDYVIGQKTFEPKVYNLTRDLRAYTPSAFSYNQAGTEQYIYNTFCLTEATWSTHTDYGLAKFKIMLTDKDGMGLGNMKFSHFTINDGNGHTYNIRTGTDDPDFDDTTQFYVVTEPTSTTTATFTYNSGTTTYIGTFPNFVSTGGVVSNFGIIELREQ